MIPWEVIDIVKAMKQDADITLLKRDKEFSIRTGGTELMNSRLHGSEEALAELAFNRIKQSAGLWILIGGLGMGYTLSAALEHSRPDTLIVVSELIPAVVRWNRQYLGHLAGMPLADHRVEVRQEDVVKTIKGEKAAWNAILLDVDNGPAGLTRKANDGLYDRSGLKSSFSALKAGGVLTVWSAAPNDAFTRRLKQCGFRVESVRVRARKSGKGSRHTIWIAEKPL